MNTIFLPMLIQVGLTFVILLFIPGNRIRDLKADPSIYKPAALDNSVYSERSRKFANSFANQLQLPVLFYVGCLLALMVGATGLCAGIFAWAFVGLRIIHAIIHVTYNNVRQRFFAFAAGVATLIGFWIVVALAAKDSPLLTGANPLTGLGG